MRRQQLLDRLNAAWAEFQASYAGLTEAQMLQPGVTGQWSVRDIIAHVTWWEEEALEHLPVIRSGGRPPRYSVTYGGIDAFNALRTEQRRHLSLRDVLRLQAEVHARLVDLVSRTPVEFLRGESRFRRRLRLDTYGHYPIHTRAIVQSRNRVIG